MKLKNFFIIKQMQSSEVTTETTTASIIDKLASTTIAPKCIVNSQPCGWGVFSKNRKKIDYFIKNTCKCASSQKCLLDGEDLSLGAYVYRCKERTATA